MFLNRRSQRSGLFADPITPDPTAATPTLAELAGVWRTTPGQRSQTRRELELEAAEAAAAEEVDEDSQAAEQAARYRSLSGPIEEAAAAYRSLSGV